MAEDTPTIRPFREPDRTALVDLWARCDLTRPWNDPDRDIDRKLAIDADLLLVAEHGAGSDAAIIGAVMAGHDGHRGSINYLAVDPVHRCRGLGGRLVDECERRLEAMGCPKVNLMVRTTNASVLAFYEARGYRVEDVVVLGKRLIPDN